MRFLKPIFAGVLLVSCALNGREKGDASLDGGDANDFDARIPENDGGDECEGLFAVVYRDFKTEHPDFEGAVASERGIVLPALGADKKPVFNEAGSFQTVESRVTFDQWYRDVAGTNTAIDAQLRLTKEAGGWVYDSHAFFPIDEHGFGNETNPHNFHFTMELHSSFSYGGGEVFTFRGDDDLFLFINGKLAIDVGGVHGAEEATADMDALASQLGIAVGNTYSFDLFFAERHTDQSNFRIETSISCFTGPFIF
ncbi:MAG: fibro-slime domain-containing protein [Myxococcales bacterium]|nr:fibro-slime domain-containing protein [Myxococcales bacterium]